MASDNFFVDPLLLVSGLSYDRSKLIYYRVSGTLWDAAILYNLHIYLKSWVLLYYTDEETKPLKS